MTKRSLQRPPRNLVECTTKVKTKHNPTKTAFYPSTRTLTVNRNQRLLQERSYVSAVSHCSGYGLIQGTSRTISILGMQLQPGLDYLENPNFKGVGENLTGRVLQTKRTQIRGEPRNLMGFREER